MNDSDLQKFPSYLKNVYTLSSSWHWLLCCPCSSDSFAAHLSGHNGTFYLNKVVQAYHDIIHAGNFGTEQSMPECQAMLAYTTATNIFLPVCPPPFLSRYMTALLPQSLGSKKTCNKGEALPRISSSFSCGCCSSILRKSELDFSGWNAGTAKPCLSSLFFPILCRCSAEEQCTAGKDLEVFLEILATSALHCCWNAYFSRMTENVGQLCQWIIFSALSVTKPHQLLVNWKPDSRR